MKKSRVSWFQKVKTFCIAHRYVIALCSILAAAIFFRFYNYPNRWGLGSDQARDAIVIRHALLNNEFPLIGPFSASGPFVFGSSWYLIFIFFTSIYPRSFLLTPWIVQSIFFVGVVLLMMKIGHMIGGKRLSLVLGILTAVSPAQIAASTNLIFSSLENIVSAIVLFTVVYLFKKKNMLSYFLLGISIGLAITVHFQAIPLMILFPICLILSRAGIKKILITIVSFCIPFIPLAIFDMQNHFFETTNIITYFLFTDKPPIPGQRWLTYAFSFWPDIWSSIAGGFPLFGYLNIFCLLIALMTVVVKRRISQTMITCLSVFFIIFVLLRYFGGQLFESFISFLQPFILLITAWMYLKMTTLNKYLGGIVLGSVILGSIIVSLGMISTAQNTTAEEAAQLRTFLEEIYPHQKYAIYDYEYKSSSISLPLVLFLYTHQETKATGRSFGISKQQLPNVHIVDEIKSPYHIFVYDLQSISPAEVKKYWVLVNPMATYTSIENWYK